MGKLLWRLLGLAAVGAIAAVAIYTTGGQQAQGPGGRRARSADEAVPVIVAQAKVGHVPVMLEGVGTVKARNTVTVRPQVDGRILSIHFREGQDVRKGDLLAKIDPATYQAQLAQALAKKTLDEVQLANAKLDAERYNRVGPNVVTQKQIDTQKALVAQLTAQIQADEAAIDNARAVLAYTDIIAPIDGKTGIRLVDEGNLVRSGDAGIVVITEVTPISVIFTLPQQDLGKVNKALAAGAVAAVALDSDGRSVLDEGVLAVVDNQVEASTGTIKLKAEMPNAKLQLWPGQFVNVRITVDTLRDVVTVPSAAVQRGPSGPFVLVVGPSDTVAVTKVKVAYQTEGAAVVSEGVKAGDAVVTTGFARLQDGSKVSVSRREAPAATSSNGGAEVRAEVSGDRVSGSESAAGGQASPKGQTASDGARAEGRGEGRRRRREAGGTP